ncbi:efflux RND transporter periplasmic adaptor subunit [Ramlibacter sp.]|uniref:efflux RND transporter periplasmic adaptor subunit n=1 Tax=Ramlibacter sp. TaxID=1917967 RepID=UPI002C9141EC|nr:efflux RND transporter periplasmic adaptor subunit [Ramlibacter sp.]HWI82934.1 efflux RND transporter periplasmic adaptor subunit [Ramlibacter sp.]
MKASNVIAGLVVLGVVGAGGYWLGGRSHGAGGEAAVAVGQAGSAGGASAPKARKILYYRNPMGLPDTSPTPKKDPMGMDYIPVYEGEDEGSGQAAGANQIRISTEKIQKLGVRTEAVGVRTLGKTVRAAGRVEPDERRVHVVAPKFEGYVERLHVNVTGQPVAKGQPLFEVYSPELVSAQREYAIAVQGVQAMAGAASEAQAGMRQLAESSLARLRNWDLSPEQVNALVKSGEARRTVTFRSPVSGIVTEKKAVQGMRFMPGEMLYQVTDLSSVWVIADVFEQDIGLVRAGSRASVKINAYPDKAFEGRITYVYPTLKAETRTVPVRVELANPGQLLKPAMFSQVEVQVGGKAPVLAVPDSAVIDSGTRRIVLVQLKEGRFEPREVKLGARSENYVEVVDGVREGEQVVVAANFLIDAESNLKAAIGGLGAAAAPAAPAAPASASPQPAAAASVGHKGQGTVDGIDAKAGTISLNHGAIASLKWPAMTMEFKAANPALLQGLKPGAAVSFEFVERQPGEWVVTSITPAPAPQAAAGKSHSGH